ncbi:MAG: tRNA (adenosine(37)-N6)-threonylcarbamoyltransferase complex ATPase subunit type 1 TsaE [Chloroflexi bacterium]|nr:tRNA (adenosine(37)-N6)-threonylcarbamoyltransferase complex ATPase subunit type 1 TsaE [Chloroflexota bacterium]MDA1226453.1 tRNA (adenosine(37)-N6)-threonylcarbamoyltransferase complex ATPase subunit type 1 TsaE [Chloroflexota bacterium]
MESHDKSNSIDVNSDGPEDTQAIGRVLGESAEPGDVFLLVGDLGAGKTCLTQGILFGLGSDEFARSPTFVLVSQYSGRLTMYHMDLYRLNSFSEVLDLGLDEYLFGDGVSVVEWADKAAGAFPESHMLVEIEYTGEESRRLRLTAHGDRYLQILSAINAR